MDSKKAEEDNTVLFDPASDADSPTDDEFSAVVSARKEQDLGLCSVSVCSGWESAVLPRYITAWCLLITEKSKSAPSPSCPVTPSFVYAALGV